MGNFVGSQTETNAGDDGNQKITEARKRYLQEKFEKDDETAISDADSSREPDFDRNRSRKPSVLNEIEMKVMSITPKDHSYPFENLVFEGGGSKGHAYAGAIKALEEIGLIKQIKRYAGASAGAMTASLLAVGYDSKDLQDFLTQDLSLLLLDSTYGKLSYLPNLMSGYGCNPANKFYDWFGELLGKKMDEKDVTFEEHYKKTGLELCVIVTNVNRMREEYCHVKTTPDMPIRLAVRMSMSLPGLFQAPNYKSYGETNLYVDGGVLCNYPIHCFDGWWLSMDSKDSFLEKLQPLNDLPNVLDKRQRFARDYKDPAKTLGFILYADAETDLFRYICEQRIGVELDPTPNTKLGREKMKLQRDQEIAKREHRRVVLAVEDFMKVLKKHNLIKNHTINRKVLEEVFQCEEFSTKSSELLFGKDCTVEDAFELLDRNKNGEINFQELINFIQGTGVSLQQRFLGYQRKEIDGLFNYALTLENAIMTNVQRAFVNRQDVDRTVGINTGHVGTSDFTLEDGDRSFAVAQGYKSTMIFLKYFVAKKLLKDAESLPELASYMSSSLRNDAREEYENGVSTGMMSWTP
ncbi:uncharacterized protein [Magallana gigas]|uniref:uncharacterized protein n=1 Tax=Magallana gigas TaxID=29159 RepID=UPI00333EE206